MNEVYEPPIPRWSRPTKELACVLPPFPNYFITTLLGIRLYEYRITRIEREVNGWIGSLHMRALDEFRNVVAIDKPKTIVDEISHYTGEIYNMHPAAGTS
eukprot:IDg18515t1